MISAARQKFARSKPHHGIIARCALRSSDDHRQRHYATIHIYDISRRANAAASTDGRQGEPAGPVTARWIISRGFQLAKMGQHAAERQPRRAMHASELT